ncbi:hypothetical protein [Labrys okinawensis]|uniref:hypothetical protein n=1 Tax=Labrys okinawensis TaxID=346911 RepID=UPI0011B2608F|nr:hypothetical protein [Labrys okinawensis]
MTSALPVDNGPEVQSAPDWVELLSNAPITISACIGVKPLASVCGVGLRRRSRKRLPQVRFDGHAVFAYADASLRFLALPPNCKRFRARCFFRLVRICRGMLWKQLLCQIVGKRRSDGVMDVSCEVRLAARAFWKAKWGSRVLDCTGMPINFYKWQAVE